MEPALARVVDRTSQDDRIHAEHRIQSDHRIRSGQETNATARAGDGPFAHGPRVVTDRSDPEAHIIRSVN